MMDGAGRGDAVFNALSAQGKLAGINQDERDSVQAQLRAVLGSDLTYIQTYAEVNPGTLTTPLGASVATTGGPAAQTGTVTANQPIKGIGVIR